MARFITAALLVAIAFTFAAALSAPEPFLTMERIERINSEAIGWKAGVNEYFLRSTEAEIKHLCGVKDDGTRLPQRELFDESTIRSLPTQFSWTDRGIVGEVRNQGSCGSCWAFGGVEALSDRMRIAGRNVNASATDPVACDSGWFYGNNGCDGGSPAALWNYLASSGAVSLQCAPYLVANGGPIPTCPPAQQPCLNFVATPSCNKTCANGQQWTQAKISAKSAYSVSSDSNQIMAEIHTHGPVEGAFTVYSDFPAYKSGVYQRSSSAHPVGGHAIEIVGWGVEGSTPYWYVRNSWTTTWGDKGYFKILRGQDECGIESGIVAGLPHV